jgi:hypothetical protein
VIEKSNVVVLVVVVDAVDVDTVDDDDDADSDPVATPAIVDYGRYDDEYHGIIRHQLT